ncbi:unnamed protein product [Rotaria magnacalcarata]|uniref:MULE transposase domain-containing protein n=1 Tax=Rotaria magnacalcarata TaxID=392030 RepID=A0A816XRR7_9BILA|nr:unnamed protein product [Rotaria magnacalcarata]
MSTFTFSATEKNKPLLICKCFAYTIDKTTNDKTIGNVNIDNHNHPGNPVSTEIRIFEEKIRHRALNSNEATQNVIDYCLTNLSDHAVARLPDFKHVKRNIQNHRVKKDLPEIPHDKTFNLIPDKLTTTKRNSLFLQFDYGPGNDRIIIFASAEQLQLLENGEQLLVDGTFKVTPSIFYQLYAIHVVYRNAVLPVVFALLPNKTQQTYRRLIDKLSEIGPSWSSKFIMMDFELASINAFGDKFVATTNSSIISGCFFTYKIVFNDLGFKTNYEQDPVFSHHVNQIAALAFLQSNDVSQGFDDLSNSLPQIVHPLLDYFEDTYVGRNRTQGRAKPVFEIELWNMHQRTTDRLMLTNNSAEAWHRLLSSIMQCQHPTL